MFDESKVREKISKLTFKKNLVFAAACCERLLPFYAAYYKFEEWGDLNFLRSTLDKIWKITKTKQFTNEEISNLADKCYSITPDSENSLSPYTHQAQNACSAIGSALEFCETNEISLLEDIALTLIDSVEMYLHQVNDPILGYHVVDSSFSIWIQTAPLLLSEINHQLEDLELLKEKEITDSLIEKIRQKSFQAGVNPEKRGLL